MLCAKVDRFLIGDVIVILAFNGTKMLQFALPATRPHRAAFSQLRVPALGEVF
jgi:hypothetical protein